MQEGYGGRFGMRWILVPSFVCVGLLGVVHQGYAESRTTDFSCPGDACAVENAGDACFTIVALELEHYLLRRTDPSRSALGELMSGLAAEANGLPSAERKQRLDEWLRRSGKGIPSSAENLRAADGLKRRMLHLDPTPEVQMCSDIKSEIRSGDPCAVLIGVWRVTWRPRLQWSLATTQLHALVAFAYDELAQGNMTVLWVADSNEPGEARKLIYDHNLKAWSYNYPGWNDRRLHMDYVPLKQFPDYVPPPWQRPGSHCGQEVVAPDGSVMVWVPGGRFTMGVSREEIDKLWAQTGWDRGWKGTVSDEPPDDVKLDGFWLGKYEVTNEQYASFLNARGANGPLQGLNMDCPACGIEYANGRYRAKPRRAQHPVIVVSWHGARAYCDYYGLSLPTESQWEYAARGPARRLFPWGTTWSSARCNNAEYWARGTLPDLQSWKEWIEGTGASVVREGAGGRAYGGCWRVPSYLKPVGSYSTGANWCGALNMAGNVAEWCAEWYHANYYRTSPFENPMGPSTGEHRVVRGGGWGDHPSFCRSAERHHADPDDRSHVIGFRVVKSFR